MPFRFVHTADIHLDSPLRSLALRDSALAELIGGATRLAFERTIDLCLDEQVDALMIAGDLYDGDQTSMKTAFFLAAQLRRLDESGIRVFIVRGNHDAESRITKELVLPEGVKVFGGRSETVKLERPRGETPVVVHGISFAKPQAPQNLVSKFKARVEDALNVGLLHTSLAGSTQHDDYSPCSVAQLASSGFDYWCLGHIHKREVHNREPFIVMPGIPQGRDINEAGPKSVTMVTVGNDGSVDSQPYPTSIAQFERVAVDLTGIEDWRGMVERVGASLTQARDSVNSEHLVVRLTLQGSTDLDWRLRRDLDVAKAEADSRAALLGRTWVEKVELNVGPGTDLPVGPVSELAAKMLGPIARSDDFKRAAAHLVEELAPSLPSEVRGVLGDNRTSRIEILEALMAEGCEAVLAHLNEGASEGCAN